MSETTLAGTTLNRDAWLLGHEITPNVERALSAEEVAYPIEETDCAVWLGHAEQFAEQSFGMKINLREMFPLPKRLPWERVLPIFDPAGLTNREMADKALKKQGLKVWEGTEVDEFTCATADASRLYLIERTPRPVPATMGLPPKWARHWFGGRQTLPLHLRGYGTGNGLLYKVEKTFLDPGAETATWFPENIFALQPGRRGPRGCRLRFPRGNCPFPQTSNLIPFGFRSQRCATMVVHRFLLP